MDQNQSLTYREQLEELLLHFDSGLLTEEELHAALCKLSPRKLEVGEICPHTGLRRTV